MFSNPDRVVQSLVRTSFVVTLDDDTTWRGVLVDADETTLALREAEHLTSEGAIPADGVIYLPRARVLFLQRA